MAAQAAKKEGNKLFTSGNHQAVRLVHRGACAEILCDPQAIIKYTEAIELDPSDVTFFSNRSAACVKRRKNTNCASPYSLNRYAALEKWEEAAEDGTFLFQSKFIS